MRPRLRALATMIAVALCGCASTTSSGPRKAADFSLRDLDGKTFHLSDHLGKDVVVMSFWATWCVPCIGEMPHLDRIYKTHKDQGLVVLGISLDGPETVAQVGPTAHRLGVTYPILLDEETRVVQSYNPRREAPFTVIIDRAGTITSQKVGHSAGDEVALEQELVALLSAAPGAGQ